MKSVKLLVRRIFVGSVIACFFFGMQCARAASHYRDAICVDPESKEFDDDDIRKIDSLIQRAAAYEAGVAGTFFTVFIKDESLANLGRGLVAAHALTKHFEGSPRARTWPVELKFLINKEQSCSSNQVLVEVLMLLNEKVLGDLKK